MRNVEAARIVKPQDSASFGCRRTRDDRPYIKSSFGRLASGGFHKLSVTTGGSPADRRSNDPKASTFATQFPLESAQELLDTLIANYNATPHSGLGYRSPLEQL
ncbi:hypothetical protein [Paraburkholderia sp. JHI869]|uniref:hypothetical protein n=1 Tax=Paraburkholderia sp. JHI869 TaxID=3112959 RepID=UPI00319E6C43